MGKECCKDSILDLESNGESIKSRYSNLRSNSMSMQKQETVQKNQIAEKMKVESKEK
jgi:hypothetical protein